MNIPDYNHRLQYNFKNYPDDNPNFYKLIMLREVHFCLSGLIIRQNCRIWGLRNLCQLRKDIFILLCTRSADVKKVSRPYIHEDHFGNTLIVSHRRWIAVCNLKFLFYSGSRLTTGLRDNSESNGQNSKRSAILLRIISLWCDTFLSDFAFCRSEVSWFFL